MTVFLIKAFQLILAFAILVIIHEFGHFIFARIFGVKVEKFYIFFDPWFDLFRWKPKKYAGAAGKVRYKNPEAKAEAEQEACFSDLQRRYADLDERLKKKHKNGATPSASETEELRHLAEELRCAEEALAKRYDHEYEQERKESPWKRFWHHTRYGVGWLPLGGYCKISGMIDESMDTEQMKKPPKPWEFRTKPAWQRLLIMIAGVLFNFLLAIVIYAGIVFFKGEEFVPFKESKGLLVYSDVAQKHGFRDGDIPVSADGKRVDTLNENTFDVGNARTVQVLRNGTDTVSLSLPSDFLMKLDKGAKTDSRGVAFISLDMPIIVKEVQSANARKAGLKEGDRLIAVDSIKTPGATKFFPALEGHANKTVNITVERAVPGNATPDTVALPVKLDGSSKIGFALENDTRKLFNTTTVKYGFFESVPRGIQKGTKMMTDYVSSLRHVFSKEGAQSIGGFGAIGNMFPAKWDWLAFWNIAAFLSVALAFMNILPIPALDGGHVLFLLFEVITGRKPSDKFMERAQIAGMVILLLLLLYANGLDIIRLFK